MIYSTHMNLTSSTFGQGMPIPEKYGRDAENINPPLRIADIPPETMSLALIMDDPDVPATAGVPVWHHWVVFNIPPHVTTIPERWDVEGVRGKGTRNELVYGGPRPPDREHRYFFMLYALDTMLTLSEGATAEEVRSAMEKHVLATAELMGTYAPR
jgi:Raf kinase inhibitor-like YbhB/YbcL family protein